jgi:hypothetical protein
MAGAEEGGGPKLLHNWSTSLTYIRSITVFLPAGAERHR